MSESRRGKRVQIYLPADLLEMWDRTPRYERSKEVARALRNYWGIDQDTDQDTIAEQTVTEDTTGADNEGIRRG